MAITDSEPEYRNFRVWAHAASYETTPCSWDDLCDGKQKVSRFEVGVCTFFLIVVTVVRSVDFWGLDAPF